MDLLRSAVRLGAAYRKSAASPVEIIEQALSRMDEAQQLGAIQWRDDDRSREAALEAQRRMDRAEARPLEGIPWTAKELLPIAGIPGLHAMQPFADALPPGSAWLAERMEAAGAILIARTSSPELGALPQTENHRGVCRNPHDNERTSGGSSGGAGVCAALGVAPFNHGSDGGGSVRIPAAWCGVVGLKPSRNRITRGPFAGDGWAGLTAEGVLANTVEDTALFLDTVAGPGFGDAVMPPATYGSYIDSCSETSPKRIALAISRDGLPVDPEVEKQVRAAADQLAAIGHVIVEDQPRDITGLEPGFGAASATGIGSMQLTRAQAETLHPRVRYLWEQGRRWSASEMIVAVSTMQQRARRIAEWFESYDALLTPTLSIPAPRIGELGADPLRAWEEFAPVLQWTWPFNVTGQPAISVPFGKADGLPAGVQLVGRIGDEPTVLALAAQLMNDQPIS